MSVCTLAALVLLGGQGQVLQVCLLSNPCHHGAVVPKHCSPWVMAVCNLPGPKHSLCHRPSMPCPHSYPLNWAFSLTEYHALSCSHSHSVDVGTIYSLNPGGYREAGAAETAPSPWEPSSRYSEDCSWADGNGRWTWPH